MFTKMLQNAQSPQTLSIVAVHSADNEPPNVSKMCTFGHSPYTEVHVMFEFECSRMLSNLGIDEQHCCRLPAPGHGQAIDALRGLHCGGLDRGRWAGPQFCSANRSGRGHSTRELLRKGQCLVPKRFDVLVAKKEIFSPDSETRVTCS